MKHFIPTALLLLSAVSSCDNDVQPREYGQGDGYEIYSLVLKEDFDSSSILIVLRDSNVTTIRSADSTQAAYLRNNLPGLLDETIAHFISANDNPAKLDYIHGAYHLVLSRDYVDSSAGPAVQLGISRVRYDKFGTQAIVEVGELFAPLAGSGSLSFLVRENGEWKIRGRVMTWIS